MTVYVGSYGSGITVFARDGARLRQTGELSTVDPSFLVADPARRLLFAVNEVDEGGVSSYAVGADGVPRLLSSQATGGALPCHLTLHKGHVIAANYGSGSVSVHPVLPDGRLGERTDLVQHHGHGPRTDRQEGPHAHQAHVDGDRVTVVDLGLDRLCHYRLEATTGRLAATGETVVRPGAGPRHVVVHGSGWWYGSNELGSTVAVYRGDPPAEVATVPASTVEGHNQPSGIALRGDLLYVGNRGADTIAVFALGPDGEPRPVGEVGTGGHWPRHFAFVDDLLFVANERSGSVVAFRLDPATGLPEPTGDVVEIERPACVLITPD
ncbi:MAG: lactonase family protein [Micromonosporaceae bacterium]|nr:lactonase family protein [Micromonosporaceae bacterium]